MRRLWQRHPRLVLAFAVALALSLFFAGRITFRTIYWAQHHQVAVQPWMTVGYIARSWKIDPQMLDQTAGLPGPERGRPQSLAQIALARGVPVAQVVAEVEAAIARLQPTPATGTRP